MATRFRHNLCDMYTPSICKHPPHSRPSPKIQLEPHAEPSLSMRAELIGHFKACITEIYLHIDARMADYIRTHPYIYGLISDMHFATHFGRRPRRIEPWAKRTVQLSLRANDAGVAPRMACGDRWRNRPRVSHRCAHIKCM